MLSELLLSVFAVWKPKTLNVSQLGSSLQVVFDQAPPSFGFHVYYLYYKLRQDGPFRLQRCRPVRCMCERFEGLMRAAFRNMTS